VDHRLVKEAPPHHGAVSLGGGSVVPYVALWSEEDVLPSRVIERAGGGGIDYADGSLTDHDEYGVLWARTATRPGHGRPVFHQMHPLRQRRAMRRMLCQVCGGPAGWIPEGHLWLLVAAWRDEGPDWPEGVVNQYPPVCVDCARLSVRLCPPLRRGFDVVRAHSRIDGVIGVQFCPAGRYPAVTRSPEDDGAPVPYTDPAAQWMLATQLTRRLYDCTPVDLEKL
jgi:hypothetical protein